MEIAKRAKQIYLVVIVYAKDQKKLKTGTKNFFIQTYNLPKLRKQIRMTNKDKTSSHGHLETKL